jgi:hypothetical protein
MAADTLNEQIAKLQTSMQTSAHNTSIQQDDFLDDFVVISDEEIKKEKALLNEFALGEQLAHGLAYEDLKDKQNIKIREEDGVAREYQVLKLHTNTNKILASIYVPSGNNTQSQIYVNFTGTCSGATVHADVEAFPGEQSFQKNKNLIMHQVNSAMNEIARKTGKPVNVTASGHSLGGALAQQFFAEAMRYTVLGYDDELQKLKEKGGLTSSAKKEITELREAIHKEDAKLSHYIHEQYDINKDQKKLPVPPVACRDGFKQTGSMRLCTWNSAGVSKEVERFGNKAATFLTEQGKKISGRFGMVGGDGVQCTGAGTVLSDCKADVANLKMDRNLEGIKGTLLQGFGGAAAGATAGLVLGPVGAVVGGTVGMLIPSLAPTAKAHTSSHFDSEGKILYPYEMLRNDTKAGHTKVKTRLQNKSKFLQSSFAKAGVFFLHKVCYAGAYVNNAVGGCFSKEVKAPEANRTALKV